MTPPPALCRLAQPGPAPPERVDSLPARVREVALRLDPGASFLEAVAAAVHRAGATAATLELEGGGFGPFAYVLPAPAPDATHVAWYSATLAPAGGARLERAAVTFGTRDGQPWLHCHAVWQEAAGRRAGHILPEETRVAAPIAARAWLLSGAGFATGPDPETNFTLFQPAPLAGPAVGARAAVIRVRPNEDLVAAVEAACRRHGFVRAVLRGGVGSLVSPRFTDGRAVPDHATEILLTTGEVAPGGGTRIAVALADMRGAVHEGVLAPGCNAVCITAELVLEEAA